MLDAQLIVFVDEDLGEQRLVAQTPVGVLAAGVDVGAVGKQSERVVEVGAGVGVVAEVGVDATGHLVEFGDDAVLSDPAPAMMAAQSSPLELLHKLPRTASARPRNTLPRRSN
ncbi:hypothetical protein [Kocuria marina]|uniref:hypothetical protein n=1 Tax=Kocuria marina TaxID=223184 RepID=UPI001EF4D740|nr:hypothetical protein [Kocuria indica]